MSRKHAELEREFIDDLPTRTGRSLDEWMSAIRLAGLSEKNAIIDWLRPQGLTFAHASWLERIHNNGGRPIYIGTAEPVRPAVAGVTAPPAAPRSLPEKPAPPRPPEVREARLVATPAACAPLPLPAQGSADLAGLLLRAKGLRPLAELLIREVRAAAPGSTAMAYGELLGFANPREFAVLLTGPKELRLGLHLGDATPDSAVSPARIPGTGGHITHMLVVNDARQVGPPLIELIRFADRLANGG